MNCLGETCHGGRLGKPLVFQLSTPIVNESVRPLALYERSLHALYACLALASTSTATFLHGMCELISGTPLVLVEVVAVSSERPGWIVGVAF